jgi:hypothetical protein
MVVSGHEDQGALVGDVRPALSPGRGLLIRRRTGSVLVQVAWTQMQD